MRRARHAACIHECGTGQLTGARWRQRSRRPDGRLCAARATWRCRRRPSSSLERRWQMANDGLQRASRCDACGTRLVSTGAGSVSPKARDCASAAADQMVGWVWLALLGGAAGVRAAAWSAGGRWRLMGYSRRADAARAARGLYPRVRARSARRRAVAPAQPPTGWSVACGLRSSEMPPASEQQLGAPVADSE
jgi:hypothetical protein